MANWYVGSTKYTSVAQWAALTTYSVGNIVRQLAAPAVGSERCFRVSAITTGISGAAEPSWTLTHNGTTADSGVTWTECTGQAAYNGDGGGSAWAAPHARLANAFASGWMAAGDTCYVSNNHAETQTTTITLAPPGSSTSPCYVYCVNDTTVPPTAVATGASITSSAGNITGGGGNNVLVYFYGISFVLSGTTNTSLLLTMGGYNPYAYYDNCTFSITSSGLYCSLNVNPATYNACSFKFNATTQLINIPASAGTAIMKGCTFAGTGTVPTYLFQTPTGAGINVILRACDLTNVNTTILNSGGAGTTSFLMENCKKNGSVVIASGSYQNLGGVFVRAHNCDSAATNYLMYVGNFGGTIQQETTIVRTGGATDGTTALSWKFASSAYTSFAFPMSVEMPAGEEIAQWNDVTGSSKTATIYLTTNATLDNSKMWIEIEYLGSSTQPLGSIATTKMAIFGSPVTLTTDSSTWGGGALTNKYSISTTFTPQMKGPVKCRIYIAAPSITVYVDPLLTIV